jgi:hypothetical protein
LTRVQVKSATARGKKRVAAAFNISMAQLRRPHQPELLYVFALARDGVWSDFLVIPRGELDRLRALEGIGYEADGGRRFLLYLSFSEDGVCSNGVSLTRFVEDWSRWPVDGRE